MKKPTPTDVESTPVDEKKPDVVVPAVPERREEPKPAPQGAIIDEVKQI